MITTEQEEAIVEGIANANLNAFNINGMLEAARFYAIHLAKTSVANMSPEEKEKVLKEIEEAQKKAEESQAEEEEASDSESDS
tara:strand:+ start:1670 stop:1918 length:249 start_codon:yes stop_codon:yes gene_type:complete